MSSLIGFHVSLVEKLIPRLTPENPTQELRQSILEYKNCLDYKFYIVTFFLIRNYIAFQLAFFTYVNLLAVFTKSSTRRCILIHSTTYHYQLPKLNINYAFSSTVLW